MNNKDRIEALRQWAEKKPIRTHGSHYDEGYSAAKRHVLGILNKEAEDIGDMNVDDVTEEQYLEFWKARGFTPKPGYGGPYLRRACRRPTCLIEVSPSGNAWLFSEGTSLRLPIMETEFNAISAFLDKVAEALGGWA
jgi:hypothetical protein